MSVARGNEKLFKLPWNVLFALNDLTSLFVPGGMMSASDGLREPLIAVIDEGTKTIGFVVSLPLQLSMFLKQIRTFIFNVPFMCFLLKRLPSH